jgi:hypothetical protein
MTAIETSSAIERSRSMRIQRPYLLAALLLALASPANAAPLDPQACAALKTEYDGLVTAGTKSDKDRGPEWAKANLSPDRLGKIERLIAVEEQLSFRCGEQMTARPNLKEPPKPPQPDKPANKTAAGQSTGDVPDGSTPSNIPPPKKKRKSAE